MNRIRSIIATPFSLIAIICNYIAHFIGGRYHDDVVAAFFIELHNKYHNHG